MTKRFTNDQYIGLVKSRFKGKFNYDKTEYTGRRNNVTVTCKRHGDFEMNAGSLLVATHGCSECGSEALQKQFLERANKIHGSRYSYEKVKFVATQKKVEIICSKHGSFFTTPETHINKKGGCPLCFQERNGFSQQEWIAKVKLIHGSKYDYSEVEYIHGEKLVKIICPDHGIFEQRGRSHLEGCGCPQCHIFSRRLTKEKFIEQAKKIHGDTYDYSKVVFITTKDNVELECRKHGSFWIRPNAHTASRGGCPRCKESKGETRVRTFLEKHEIEFVQEFKIPTHGYRYDFYVPEYKMLIEFHGNQHFKPVQLFGGERYFKETVRNDKAKEKLAKRLGFYLHTLNFRQMKDNGVEVNLEMALRHCGHVFKDNITITSNNGPRRMETSY